MRNAKGKEEAAISDYDLAPQELRPVRRAIAKQRAIAAPRVKLKENTICIDHPHKLIGATVMMGSLGTVLDGVLHQLAKASGSPDAAMDEHNLNFMLSVVAGLEPNDQLESLIGAYMAATHIAAMTAAEKLARSPFLVEKEMAERRFTKLMRSFMALVAALDGHRRRPEAPVSVNNVSVSDGGQAVVGNVTRNSARRTPKSAMAPAASTDARRQPVREVVPAKRRKKP